MLYIKDIKKNFKNIESFNSIFNLHKEDTVKFQRLEFLGDRVLGLVLADILFNKFEEYNEGKLAKFYAFLSSAKVIAITAKRIGLEGYVIQKGFKNISERVLSDFLEAIIGALYLDIGIEKTKHIIYDLWDEEINNDFNFSSDYKSVLQEWTQSKKLGLPEYKVINKIGPDHKPIFYISLIVNGVPKETGTGASIQLAEQNVAKSFLKENKIIE